jgi:hypothetical protein
MLAAVQSQHRKRASGVIVDYQTPLQSTMLHESRANVAVSVSPISTMLFKQYIQQLSRQVETSHRGKGGGKRF